MGAKRRIDAFNMYPMPAVIVGTETDGKPNFMTVAWAVKLQGSPPLVGIVVSRGHHTARGIGQTGQFSVSFPSHEQAVLADYCGLYSGRHEDKAAKVEVFRGTLEAAPMVGQCPLTAECRLQQTVELRASFFYIGEVVNVYADEDVLHGDEIDTARLRPIAFTRPEKVYWTLGQIIGPAWKMGEALHGEE